MPIFTEFDGTQYDFDPASQYMLSGLVNNIHGAAEFGHCDAAENLLRRALSEAWARGASNAYWDERGYQGKDDVPEHLRDEFAKFWNPYYANNAPEGWADAE